MSRTYRRSAEGHLTKDNPYNCKGRLCNGCEKGHMIAWEKSFAHKRQEATYA